MAGLREGIAKLIAQSTGTPADALLADTPFVKLGYDSLDVVEIRILVDEAYGTDLEGKVTARNLPKNLSDLARLVEDALREKESAR